MNGQFVVGCLFSFAQRKESGDGDGDTPTPCHTEHSVGLHCSAVLKSVHNKRRPGGMKWADT